MKKSFVVNCVIITGLLVLCVMTLLAVYATGPEASVLILDETFSNLDKSKWRHEISSCSVDGNQFHYDREDGENGFAADGILRLYSNLTNKEFKIKREAINKCPSCSNCDSFFFSASLETKEIFYVTAGKIEFRAKFRKGDRIRFQIGIISNDTKLEVSRKFTKEEEEMRANDFSQFLVIFKSANNQTVLKGAVLDNNFHIYEIEWNSDKIKLYIDHMEVNEEIFEPTVQAKRFSNATAHLRRSLTIEPFFLSIKVNFDEKLLDNSETHSDSESLNKTIIEETKHFPEASVLEIDYIKLYKMDN